MAICGIETGSQKKKEEATAERLAEKIFVEKIVESVNVG